MAATVNAAFDLGNMGDHKQALRWLVREISRPRNAESPFTESLLYPIQVLAFGAMGELGDVRRIMSESSNSGGYQGVTAAGKLWITFWDKLEEGEASLTALIGIFRHQQRAENICNFGADAAHLFRLTGHYTKAEELLREGLSYSVPGGNIALELMGRECLAHVLADMARTDEARSELGRCREIMAAGEDWRGLAGLVEWSAASIAVAEKRLDDADHYFAVAIDIIRRYSMRDHEGPALSEWGRTLLAAGHRDRALEKFDEALDLYRRVGAGQPWIDYVEAARQSTRNDQTSVAGQFRKEGHYWRVRFGGETFRLKDSKSLRVIAHLIRSPGHQFHARELAALGSPNQPVAPHFDENVGADSFDRPRRRRRRVGCASHCRVPPSSRGFTPGARRGRALQRSRPGLATAGRSGRADHGTRRGGWISGTRAQDLVTFRARAAFGHQEHSRRD